MRRSPQGWTALTLIGWLAWFLLSHPAPAPEAASRQAARPAPPASRGFDRAALREALSPPAEELRGKPDEALRVHLRQLVELSASLETAAGIPAPERRALSDRILVRVAEVGVLLRQRAEEPLGEARSRRSAAGTSGLAALGGLAGALLERSGLLIGLLGGVLIAFALGNLAGYRWGTRQASYYGEGDPWIRFLARPPSRPAAPGRVRRIALPQIQESLARGRTVLLQLGYEVALDQRAPFLKLTREMRRALGDLEGIEYTVWEDPRHPNRFYEILLCHGPTALDRLAATEGTLPRLAAAVEACRMPGSPILRRAWWGVHPEPRPTTAPIPPMPDVPALR